MRSAPSCRRSSGTPRSRRPAPAARAASPDPDACRRPWRAVYDPPVGMKIAVIGASGWLGGAVAREAVARGHEVTAIGRDETKLRAVGAARVAIADVGDPESLQRAIAGSDAVVLAITDRSTADRSIIPRTTRTLLDVLPAAGVGRLAVIGGGGSLEVAPGVRAIDSPVPRAVQSGGARPGRGARSAPRRTPHSPGRMTRRPTTSLRARRPGAPCRRRRCAGDRRERREPDRLRRPCVRARRRARAAPFTGQRFTAATV